MTLYDKIEMTKHGKKRKGRKGKGGQEFLWVH